MTAPRLRSRCRPRGDRGGDVGPYDRMAGHPVNAAARWMVATPFRLHFSNHAHVDDGDDRDLRVHDPSQGDPHLALESGGPRPTTRLPDRLDSRRHLAPQRLEVLRMAPPAPALTRRPTRPLRPLLVARRGLGDEGTRGEAMTRLLRRGCRLGSAGSPSSSNDGATRSENRRAQLVRRGGSHLSSKASSSPLEGFEQHQGFVEGVR